MPPAFTVDDKGNALHSWRVLILPQLGRKDLYDKIKLDEPWNSDHNKQFHAEDLPVFRYPNSPAATPGMTSYVVAVGDELPFDGSGKGRKLSEFGSHSGEMILVSETKSTACWMAPGFDMPYENVLESVSAYKNSTKGTKIFESIHSGGFNLGKRNGGVMFVSETMAKEAFDAMLKGIEYVKEDQKQAAENVIEDNPDETTDCDFLARQAPGPFFQYGTNGITE